MDGIQINHSLSDFRLLWDSWLDKVQKTVSCVDVWSSYLFKPVSLESVLCNFFVGGSLSVEPFRSLIAILLFKRGWSSRIWWDVNSGMESRGCWVKEWFNWLLSLGFLAALWDVTYWHISYYITAFKTNKESYPMNGNDIDSYVHYRTKLEMDLNDADRSSSIYNTCTAC